MIVLPFQALWRMLFQFCNQNFGLQPEKSNQIMMMDRIENIQIRNRSLMSTKCSKCTQIKQNAQILTCGHSLCPKCLPQSNYTHEFIVSCPSCSIMTILESNLPPVDANPENYLVCLECRSDVMTSRGFLESPHRNHDVVSVANIVHDVQKSLRKYQLSFDLQSQALYTQAESLSKQKRIICDQYSKNCQQIQSLFEQLKNSIEISQTECTKEYEKLVMQIIETYDSKIKQIKSQIFKCESFIQCIDHSLIKSNASKYVAATQFYFLNFPKLQDSLTELIEMRKEGLNQIGGKGKLKCPDLKPICQLIRTVKNISQRVWNSKDSRRQALLVNKNPEAEPQSFFEVKRKQIFDLSTNNQNANLKMAKFELQSIAERKGFNLPNKQKPIKLQQSREASMTSESKQTYNIEGRIQNLRRTLKLGEKKCSNIKSSVSLCSGYKLF